MEKMPYNHVFNMLKFCRSTIKDTSMYSDEEKQRIVDEYMQSLEGTVEINVETIGVVERSIPEKLMITVSYMVTTQLSLLNHLSAVLKLKKFFKPLAMFCDCRDEDITETKEMIQVFNKIADGDTDDKELSALAKFIEGFPSQQKQFRIRLFCGIVACIDLSLMAAATILQFMNMIV